MYNHVLFDADNTLLDFDRAQLICFKKVIEYYDLPFSEDTFQKYESINHVLWQMFEQGKIDKDSVQSLRFKKLFSYLNKIIDGAEANHIFQQELSKQSALMPFADEICKNLSKFTSLSIVTNGVGSTQHERIDNSMIKEYISNVVVSEEIGYAKPSYDFFKAAFRIIRIKPTDRVLIVGDSLSSDIQGGIKAGIDTCWFNYKIESLPTDMKVNYIITDLRELNTIVLR